MVWRWEESTRGVFEGGSQGRSSHAASASRLVLQMGPLARWLLSESTLELAAGDSSVPKRYRDQWRGDAILHAAPGACWPVFAVTLPDCDFLRKAFLLPLQWRRDVGHCPLLPKPLRRLAGRVVEGLAEAEDGDGDSWGLHLGSELQGADLEAMPLMCESAWASLAAGLLVAKQGGRPDAKVLASGGWEHERGIQPVEFLEAKLGLAREYGVQVFFIPSQQVREAERLAPELEVGGLSEAEPRAAAALADLTLRLEAPPSPPAHAKDASAFARCVEYYLRQPVGAESTRAYYADCLLPTIVNRCREKLAADYPNWKPTHLATFLSGSPELVPIVAGALDVRHCLLLYTEASNGRRNAVEDAVQILRQAGVNCTASLLHDGLAMVEQIPNAVRQFTTGVSPDSAVLDITPGTKWMTWTADHAMPPASWRIYVHHDSLGTDDRRPRPGSEQLICWRGTDPSSLNTS